MNSLRPNALVSMRAPGQVEPARPVARPGRRRPPSGSRRRSCRPGSGRCVTPELADQLQHVACGSRPRRPWGGRARRCRCRRSGPCARRTSRTAGGRPAPTAKAGSSVNGRRRSGPREPAPGTATSAPSGICTAVFHRLKISNVVKVTEHPQVVGLRCALVAGAERRSGGRPGCATSRPSRGCRSRRSRTSSTTTSTSRRHPRAGPAGHRRRSTTGPTCRRGTCAQAGPAWSRWRCPSSTSRTSPSWPATS